MILIWLIMKKNLIRFCGLIISVVLILGCSESTGPKQGVHYQKLSKPLSSPSLAPITEVFALTCTHCRTMETFIPELEQLTGQRFGKLHVTFNQGAQLGAMIYYSAVMQLDGIPDHDMMDDLFAAVQMPEGTTPAERKAAIDHAFHSRHIISPYDFNEMQQQQLMTILADVEQMSAQAQINAVPTFIVNGKYLLLTSGHSDLANMAETLTYLLKQP